MRGFSVPVAIPVNEHYRLLAYLKAIYKVGYFPKSEMPTIRKALNKDMRSVKKYIKILLNDGLIGQDDKMIYLRSWPFILYQIESKTLQAFRVENNELRNKTMFESMLLSSKIKVLEKASRLSSRDRSKGRSNQIEVSTGSLSSLCNISFGKVSQIKQVAKSQGFIKVESNSILLDLPPKTLKYLDKPKGVYVKNGKVYKRGTDKFMSLADTLKKEIGKKINIMKIERKLIREDIKAIEKTNENVNNMIGLADQILKIHTIDSLDQLPNQSNIDGYILNEAIKRDPFLKDLNQRTKLTIDSLTLPDELIALKNLIIQFNIARTNEVQYLKINQGKCMVNEASFNTYIDIKYRTYAVTTEEIKRLQMANQYLEWIEALKPSDIELKRYSNPMVFWNVYTNSFEGSVSFIKQGL